MICVGVTFICPFLGIELDHEAIKSIASLFVPYGIMRYKWARKKNAMAEVHEQIHARRREKIKATLATRQKKGLQLLDGRDYQSLVAFCCDRGLSHHHVTDGSVPESSLELFVSN